MEPRLILLLFGTLVRGPGPRRRPRRGVGLAASSRRRLAPGGRSMHVACHQFVRVPCCSVSPVF